MPRISRLLAVVAVVAAPLLLASPAAAIGEEKIDSYDVQLSVGSDGVLDVLETIQYDFGFTPHHGIYRTIPVRYPYDDTYERVLKVSDIRVQSDAPDNLDTSNEGNFLVLKIGDKDKTITGKHTYTISYSVRGALNAFTDHVELSWNAIGVDWPVPISDIHVTAQMPGDVTGTTCFSGRSTPSWPATRRRPRARQRRSTRRSSSPMKHSPWSSVHPCRR